jgi:aminomethyltransferase
MRRVEAGILGNLTDMDTDMTPYAAGLGDFVNLDKGDFIGRDALANADRGRLLMGLTCATTTPGAGNIVRDGNKAVARIRMGVTSPTLGLGIGYVHFDTPGDWIGRELTLEDAGGSHHAVNIVDVPFFDPERKIVRGIDRTIPSGPVT